MNNSTAIERRQFTDEELHLLYTDVLVPYTNHQYDVVYERLIEQFTIHESFNLDVIDLFIASACYTGQHVNVLNILTDIAFHSSVGQQSDDTDMINNNDNVVDRTTTTNTASTVQNLNNALLVQYASAKLLWKIGEFVQCFQVVKSLLSQSNKLLSQKTVKTETVAAIDKKQLNSMNTRSWYLLAKLYFQYITSSHSQVIESFKYCLKRSFQSSNSTSWRVLNKFCDMYIAITLLEPRNLTFNPTKEREWLEYAKLNIVMAMQHFVKHETVIVVQYNRMKLKKMSSKLSLIKQMIAQEHSSGSLPILEQLQYYVYTLKDSVSPGDDQINDMYDQFKSYYRRGNKVNAIRHDLFILRSIAIPLAIRAQDWEQAIQYTSVVIKYCPSTDPSTRFYHELAVFHSTHSLILELSADDTINSVDNEEQSTNTPKWNHLETVCELDVQLLKAKLLHVHSTLNRMAPIEQYTTVLKMINSKQMFKDSIYSFLLHSNEIRYEAHSVIGVRLFLMNNNPNATIYHLYQALVLNDPNTYLWSCFIQVLRKQVAKSDPILYMKALYLYIQHLREQQLQENTNLVVELQDELNRMNSPITLVAFDNRNDISLPSLSSEYKMKRIIAQIQEQKKKKKKGSHQIMSKL